MPPAITKKRRKSTSFPMSTAHPAPPSLLPATVFLPPLPSLIHFLPPSSRLQWVLRLALLFFTLVVSCPLIAALVPLSVFCLAIPHPSIRRLSPLPIHPHNLPPHRSLAASILRGWIIYALGSVLWALTSSGNAPEYNPRLSRRITRAACRLAEWVSRHTDRGRLDVQESQLPPVPDELCVGALALPGLKKEPVTGFWLRHVADDESNHNSADCWPVKTSRGRTRTPRPVGNASPASVGEMNGTADRRTHRQAILLLAGGGYVTSFPLVQPLTFSLSLSYPAGEAPVILAPEVRKSLDLDRSFPIPLLDALAGYVELRRQGFEPEDIVVMGDSAGAGLTWSLVSYLAIWRETGSDQGGLRLGVPGRVVFISPWLSLPPTVSPPYPDAVDEPMLLGATRCYLARFPVVKHRPDPFVSDFGIWLATLSRHARRHLAFLSQHLHSDGWPLVPYSKFRYSATENMAAELLQPQPPSRTPQTLLEWLEPAIFAQVSSHHPFVSPCSDAESPFVTGVLALLADNGTKMYVHAGTAEWFRSAGADMARAAKRAGLDVVWHEEQGGFHVESVVYPAELGGAAGRLLAGLRMWLDPQF